MPPQEHRVGTPSGAHSEQAPPPGGAAHAAEPDVREHPIEPEDVAEAAQIEAEAEAEAPEEDALAALRERAAKADEYLDLAQRAKADFANYRKRMTRDVQAAEARGTGRLAKELLPALDNLERALAAVERSEGHEEHHMAKGFRLVQSELAAALNRTGIEGFTPRGEPFDPSEHEAVAQQPVEGAEAGTIVEVLQAGYRLNGAILRPARVIVAG
ncbi:MAG: nucleotide exchange factor GrpE [Actinomycetota bacterium]|nr:nucleotide exchange factor GrpE [Actinomycetota bacterium]